MSWWGKLAGGGLGFALGGPLGAMIGTILGHQLDKPSAGSRKQFRFNPGSQERTQAVFFTATFSVMGHLAKADGRVSPEEIKLAERVMQQMHLNNEQRKAAIELFYHGKGDEFVLDEVLDQFRKECRRKITLIQMFIEIQLQAVYADGEKHLEEDKILKYVCNKLGYPYALVSQLESLILAQQRNYQQSGTTDSRSSAHVLKDAYRILGISSSNSDSELKKSYRRLMSQHHPDKLISKGLPEEMIEIATDKTQEIQKAYDLISKHRKSLH